jgi:hypothetical protein
VTVTGNGSVIVAGSVLRRPLGNSPRAWRPGQRLAGAGYGNTANEDTVYMVKVMSRPVDTSSTAP